MNFERELTLRHLAGSLMPADMPLIIGDGWYHIVRHALSELCNLSLRSRLSIEVTRIAVEDGGLVVDTNIDHLNAPEAVRRLVSAITGHANDQARARCQTCGGHWRSFQAAGSWRTRCDDCNNLYPVEG